MTAACDGSCTAPAPVSKSNDVAGRREAVAHAMGPSLICKDLSDWLLPDGRAYQALLVRRPQNPDAFQQHVDSLAVSGAEHMELSQGMSKARFALDLPERARRLAALAVQHGLPEDLGSRIQEDFHQIGMVLAELVPAASKMSLKLEIMGENTCSRWHRDNYVGRAIVTYNACGTQYVADDNVNFQHLHHRGCADLIRDESQIFSADVGDILFMKGRVYPGMPNGLVHRSPPIRWSGYQPKRQVVKRLLLKVDLN